MNKLKAYYGPQGYQLYMPDGTPLPFLRQISVHDNWIEATTRCGGPEMIHDQATADANFYVEVVNEQPVCEPDYINKEIQKRVIEYGLKAGSISDGYHTFDELYEHRIALFKCVCKNQMHWDSSQVWKSKIHSDGSALDGWFIAGIFECPGMQITYHIPIKEWDSWPGNEREKAPEWDGHTSADVLKRLAEL